MRELSAAEIELVSGGFEEISGDPVRDEPFDPLRAWAIQFRAGQAAEAESAGMTQFEAESDWDRLMRRLPGTEIDDNLYPGSLELAPMKDGPIIVTGQRAEWTSDEVSRAFAGLDQFAVLSSIWSNAVVYENSSSTMPDLDPFDAAIVEIDINIDRELTAEEQKAVRELESAIGKITLAINSLPDDASITLPNGETVTGLELKALWRMTDFVINEIGTNYANGSKRGEADYNGGNPVFRFNIDIVSGYTIDSFGRPIEGGANYLVLHELGHVTIAGRDSNAAMYDDGAATDEEVEQNERLANDIALAVATAGGIPIIEDPNYGYTVSQN